MNSDLCLKSFISYDFPNVGICLYHEPEHSYSNTTGIYIHVDKSNQNAVLMLRKHEPVVSSCPSYLETQ